MQEEKRKATREKEDFLAKKVGKVLRSDTVRITVMFMANLVLAQFEL